MVFFEILTLAGKVYAALTGLVAGQPVVINTYIGKQHLSVTVQEIV